MRPFHVRDYKLLPDSVTSFWTAREAALARAMAKCGGEPPSDGGGGDESDDTAASEVPSPLRKKRPRGRAPKGTTWCPIKGEYVADATAYDADCAFTTVTRSFSPFGWR